MSRCFPYPPPGYSLNRSKDDALIELIKLQKEKEKAQRKKEKKREKREKKKEKYKEGKKEDKKEEKRKRKEEKKNRKEEKGKENKETEQLERSSLSEEHGEPVYSYDPSSSFGNTEHSNKRKRHSSPINSSLDHGNIIKIRITSRKQNEPDSLDNGHQGCSTSGRTDLPPQKKDNVLRDGLDTIRCSNIEANGEHICSTSKPFESISSCETRIPSVPKAALSKRLKEELWCKDLFENLAPLHSLNECFEPNEDWLFQDRHAEIKRQRCGNDDISFSSSTGLWPRAQYLNEANIHALPFTVPF